jgi:PAS domain S-box-containing protein
MIVSDPRQPDNPVVLANQAFLDLTGYPAAEVIGRNCRFLQGAETAADDIDRLRIALARGDDHVEVEILNYRKDGSSFWNQLAINAVRDNRGVLLYHLGSQKDVSARRYAEQLEASERRLLMEIDHRAMNALALVQSIISLSCAESADGFTKTVAGRVAALARAHRLLAEQRWTHVDLLHLIDAPKRHDVDTRFTVSGTAAHLRAHVVQPLALVLHEMQSNAVAHGGLSTDTGKVVLSWETDGPTLALCWHEEGPTVIGPFKRGKFGLQIVESTVPGPTRRSRRNDNWRGHA